MPEFSLRPYETSDESIVISLWHRTWTQAYPDIDFTARLASWRTRWRNELAPFARIMIAESQNRIAGFVTVDRTGYLDQLVVDPEFWGASLGDALIEAAKALSPDGLTLLVNTDNSRAIRFYTRNGFRHTHDDVNPVSGRPVHAMAWKP